MLTEFDQNTLANMTAALETVCRKIPADKDSHDLRKQVGNAMIEAAKSGNRNFADLQVAGHEALEQLLRPPKSGWLRWFQR
jgi:hypothetical protein